MMIQRWSLKPCSTVGFCLLFVLLTAPTVRSDEKAAPAATALISVAPADPVLVGPRATQRLVATGRQAGGREQDWTRIVQYESLTPAVVSVDAAGVVRPVADGEGIVRVRASDGQTAEVKVLVRNCGSQEPVSFANDIAPRLTKAGCNMGACHGAQHGKGGFKLSLFGFEPDPDYTAIVKDAEGRRVEMLSPADSLLLLKPTISVAHGGGKRTEVDGPLYNTVRLWLEQGAPAPADWLTCRA